MSEELESLLNSLTQEYKEQGVDVNDCPYAIIVFNGNDIDVKLNKWKHFNPRNAESCKKRIIRERTRLRKETLKGNIPEED
jgi:hypothetical protein